MGHTVSLHVVTQVKNHLKALAKQGNTAPLEDYESKTSQSAKRNFVKDLSLDFEGSFAQAKETKEGKRTVGSKLKEGWLYMWEVAREEGLQYCESNKPPLEAIVKGM